MRRNAPEIPVIGVALFSFQFGGSETVGVDLALEFKRRGYRVVGFALHDSEGPMRVKLESAGIRCLDMNYEKYGGVLRRVHYAWAFWRMLRRERISTLHMHHYGAMILCGVAARLAGVSRIVMTEHGIENLLRYSGHRRLAMRYCRFASAITAVEPGQIDYFREALRFNAAKLHYIPNGARIPARTSGRVVQKRAELGIPADVFAFFFVGRLNPIKDLGTLLDAYAALPSEVASRSRLFLVGEGPERAMLEAKREALRLGDRAILLGARDDVSELLMAADALVMSSKSEGLPMVLLEAMAAGTPCVATAVGGIPPLFGKDRGLAVPPQNPTALAAAMARIAQSPELRARIVANAMDNLRRHHTLDAIADRYLDLLGLPPEVSDAAA
jgi:L-malate glycosyltransferase